MAPASKIDLGPMPSHSVFCAWHGQGQDMWRSNGGKIQLVCLWYYVSLCVWGPLTSKIKFFFLSTPNLADASIIAEQMFSLENLFPIPDDEESPSENKQTYICVSSSKTKPSISDERQQKLYALGNRYQTGWKSLKDLFLCHFYLRFFTVLPSFQQLQFGTLILDFIVYFPQCSLHQTDKRYFYILSILNVLI